MTKPLAWRYRYRAKVVRVIDGDGLLCAVDCGLRLTYEMNVRLRGCNAAEKATPPGKDAIDFVTQWAIDYADADGWLAVVTHKNPEDPHGRWMADVESLDNAHDLTTDLIAVGLAVAWDGHGDKPVPTLVPPDLPPAA